ncbi:MAG: ABC transporter ATP-binding protein [Acidobacteriota bacterium]
MTASGGRAFRWLVGRYARPFSGAIALMVALTCAANLLTVLQPAILAALLANLSGTARQTVPPGTSWLNLNYLGVWISQRLSGRTAYDVLALFGVLFVAVSVVVAGLNYLAESTASWLRAHIGRAIQSDLLTHLVGQDMAFFARQKSGELISRVTFDASATATALGPLIRSLIHNLVQIAVYSAYLFSTSAWLTAGAILLLLVQFGLTQALKRPTRRMALEETDVSAGLTGALQEAFTSIRVAKSFGAEAFELDKLRGATDAVVAALWKKGRMEKLEISARSILDSLAVLGVFFIAIAQMRAGYLTFQGLLLFTFVARSLISPINQLATSALWIESVGAAAGRIDELLAARPQVVDGSTSKATFDTALRIEDCSFGYGGHIALDGVTLEIRKGEFVALVGSSGAGKSTLADLILRLYDPDKGRILIDGVDLRTLNQRDYRHLFGVVSQESLLFHDSVRTNIRYGREHLSDAMVEDAARVAHAHDFIMRLPRQYDTVVGDRGLRLSGGERQRIAIARAVVHNPEILILDEATSALDSESERLVQQAINQVASRATAIVIAHRLSTVTHADRIVVLDRGRIESSGRHDELLATSATYRRLCELQFGWTADEGSRPAPTR